MQLLLGILSVGFATFSQFLLTRAGQVSSKQTDH